MKIFTNKFAKLFNSSVKEIADVYLYEEIGYNGVTAQEFKDRITSVKVDRINLHINSPGGSVHDAAAMYQTLKDSKAEVYVLIDGLAAAEAALIAMAGDTIEIAANAFLMLAQPAVIMWGQAPELRAEAKILDKLEASQADTFSKRSSNSKKQILSWMRDETWFNADEAVSNRLANLKGVAARKPDAQASRWDLQNFKNAPGSIRGPGDRVPVNLLRRRLTLTEKLGG